MDSGTNALAYQDEGAGSRTLDLMTEARNYNRWLFRRIEAALGQRVLEIGSGTGTMTEYLLDRELVLGLEVIPEYVHALRRRFADHPNVRIEGLDITSTSYDFSTLDIDSAVSFNVFEHIPDDVAAMRQVYHALRPGGRLALVVPAHQALYGSFDYLIGHQRRYGKGDLAEKLRSAGFDVDSISYSNPLGALGWLVNFRLLGQMQLKAVRAYDGLVPILAAAERLIRPPFGLSVVAIARKPGERGSAITQPWYRQPHRLPYTEAPSSAGSALQRTEGQRASQRSRG
jgi:SAM-dependent methyltransferase